MKNVDKNYNLIVIGGGASGIMTAATAAKNGASVLIIEKNNTLGKKLKITGGGRCNITNANYNNRSFLENFGYSGKFLFSPFSKFSVKDTFSFFEKRDLPLVIESRKRVFPKTQKALDVLKVFERDLKKYKVDIIFNTQVVKLNRDGEKISSIRTKSGKIYSADFFAMATGGVSAPKTGSTGEGFVYLSKIGHTIKKPNPNVVPVTTDNSFLHKISGTSWSFMKISFIQNGKTAFSKTGKILFTHFGFSGPLILNSSYEIKNLLKNGSVVASIDLFPDTEFPALEKKIQNHFDKNSKKNLKNSLVEFLPKRVAWAILDIIFNKIKIDISEKKVSEITKDERKILVHQMKNLNSDITGTLGMDKSVISDGGVILEEVDFSNSTSKLFPNLYLLGDILNINRPSGGYSLQLCWTLGNVAGKDVAEKVKILNKIEEI